MKFGADRIKITGSEKTQTFESYCVSFSGHFVVDESSSNVTFLVKKKLDINKNGIHVYVGVCYRPHNLEFLADFKQVLLDLMARYSHVIVMGDFNTDLKHLIII